MSSDHSRQQYELRVRVSVSSLWTRYSKNCGQISIKKF